MDVLYYKPGSGRGERVDDKGVWGVEFLTVRAKRREENMTWLEKLERALERTAPLSAYSLPPVRPGDVVLGTAPEHVRKLYMLMAVLLQASQDAEEGTLETVWGFMDASYLFSMDERQQVALHKRVRALAMQAEVVMLIMWMSARHALECWDVGGITFAANWSVVGRSDNETERLLWENEYPRETVSSPWLENFKKRLGAAEAKEHRLLDVGVSVRETVIAAADEHLRRLFCVMADADDRRKEAYSQLALNHDAPSEQLAYLNREFCRASRERTTAEAIFQVSAKDTYDLWDVALVAMRRGWCITSRAELGVAVVEMIACETQDIPPVGKFHM
jgi:hypothetical protein